MMALGMTALHLRIADFKFTHNFTICDRLPDTEIIFGIDVQKKFSLSYAWGQKEELLHTEGQQISHIPPRHNGIIPIKIKGHSITGHMACFISNHKSTKGKDPNMNTVNGIHNIKGKTSVNILVSNYTNKHIKFNNGEYVGHWNQP